MKSKKLRKYVSALGLGFILHYNGVKINEDDYTKIQEKLSKEFGGTEKDALDSIEKQYNILMEELNGGKKREDK